jgi:hypothetical protein
VAGTVRPLPPEPPRPNQRPEPAAVIETLDAETTDPWKLIAFVEMGTNRPPHVLFDLACFYSLASYFNKATKRLLDAVRDFPKLQRPALVEAAAQDPTLEALRSTVPNLFAKLQTMVRPPDAPPDRELDKQAARFDRDREALDWFESQGWTVSWADPKSGLSLIGERDEEVVLVKAVAQPPDDGNQALNELLGAREQSRTAYPGDKPIRTAMIFAATAPLTEAQIEAATNRRVDVYREETEQTFVKLGAADGDGS